MSYVCVCMFVHLIPKQICRSSCQLDKTKKKRSSTVFNSLTMSIDVVITFDLIE